MALAPAITDLEQLKDHPAVAALLSWKATSVQAVKYDRGEMTVTVERASLREACILMRDHANCAYNYFSDVTCVDRYPSEPRFEMIYHLLSHSKKERLRLKVLLDGNDPVVDAITPIWPGANYAEREVFDLFGIRFNDHPYLRRILMPEDWQGHPLRKDYPVEGYR